MTKFVFQQSSDVEEIGVRGLELRVASASISTVVSSW